MSVFCLRIVLLTEPTVFLVIFNEGALVLLVVRVSVLLVLLRQLGDVVVLHTCELLMRY
jgi:hypothetical protein